MLSSSDPDLPQQLLEAAVSKQASTDGSGNVTLILQGTPLLVSRPHVALTYPGKQPWKPDENVKMLPMQLQGYHVTTEQWHTLSLDDLDKACHLQNLTFSGVMCVITMYIDLIHTYLRGRMKPRIRVLY